MPDDKQPEVKPEKKPKGGFWKKLLAGVGNAIGEAKFGGN
jgi:hypothetical protein